MAGFKITFAGAISDFELTWILNDNPLSIKWLEKLDYVSQNKTIDNARRFYGLPQASKQQVYSCMTDAIIKLNDTGFDIPVKSIDQFDHNWLNFLHDYFATNHGRDYELKSQQLEQRMVHLWNQLHISLHRYESLLNNKLERQRIVATWRAQGELMQQYDPEDYEHFTWDTKFGDVFINYRQVGRSAFDIFNNGDILDKSVLVNSTDWCADFKIHFFDMHEQDFIRDYWQWFENNLSWFKENFGFTTHDARANPGLYPVARLETTLQKEQILRLLSDSPGIKSIQVY